MSNKVDINASVEAVPNVWESGSKPLVDDERSTKGAPTPSLLAESGENDSTGPVEVTMSAVTTGVLLSCLLVPISRFLIALQRRWLVALGTAVLSSTWTMRMIATPMTTSRSSMGLYFILIELPYA